MPKPRSKSQKFAVIVTITYTDAVRKLRGDSSGDSLEAVAKKLAACAEYHRAIDADKFGFPKTINFRFRPLLGPAKPKKKR